MAVTPNPSTDEEAVPLGLLRRYLMATGWARRVFVAPRTLSPEQSAIARAVLDGRTGGRREFEQFVLHDGEMDGIEIILPRDRSSPDYLRQIRGALRTLSDIQERDTTHIITDIRLVGFDVMRSRIPNAMVVDDTILLEVARGYITGVRNLLAATATTEIQPEPFFLRVKKEATEYADGCRFGHTFRGSFGFTVESPVLPNNTPTLPIVDQPAPFSRRVIERMVRGVSAVVDAVTRDDTTDLVANAKVGFSANACEQFADLIEQTSLGGLAFAFALSPEWRAPPDLVQVKEFIVGPQHVEVTKAAAKEMRKHHLPRAENIVGRVVRLESDADPSDLINPMGDREIAIHWSSAELGGIDVRVSLGAADYLLALEAHRDGRSVTVDGTLEKRGRPWVLSGPTGFSIIS
ncbi:MAG TPA: hypothetical protein PKX13_13470 [Acidiphilium sp.]|nr:hypothetical protein [Acidiphilium sp.]